MLHYLKKETIYFEYLLFEATDIISSKKANILSAPSPLYLLNEGNRLAKKFSKT